MVVEETPPQAAISDLPASPDEVIVWSNEAAVLAELRQQYGSVTPSDSYVMPRGRLDRRRVESHKGGVGVCCSRFDVLHVVAVV